MAKIRLKAKAKPKTKPLTSTALTPTLALPQASPASQHSEFQDHSATTRGFHAISNAQISDPSSAVAEETSKRVHSPSHSNPDANSELTVSSINNNATTITKMTLLEINEAFPILQAAFDKAINKQFDIHELCTQIRELLGRVKEVENGAAHDSDVSCKQPSMSTSMSTSMSMSMNRGIENSWNSGMHMSGGDVAMGMATRRELKAKSTTEDVSKEKPLRGAKKCKQTKTRRAPKRAPKKPLGRGGGEEESLGMNLPKEGWEDEEQRILITRSETRYREMQAEIKFISDKLAILEMEVNCENEKEIEVWAKRIVERLELELAACLKDRGDGLKDMFGLSA